MPLVNPNELIVDAAALFIDFDMTYIEPSMGLTQYANFGLISFDNSSFLASGEAVMWRVESHQIAPQTVLMYINVRSLITNLACNAEHINTLFFGINRFVLGKTDEEFKAPRGKEFMTLKNNIVSYVKRDEETKHLLSRKLKTALEFFVNYRNIFTHGKLRLLCVAPEGFVNNTVEYPPKEGKRRLITQTGRLSAYEWYITYLNASDQAVSIKITKELLEDYGQVYADSIEFISAFRKVKPSLDTLSSAIQEHIDKKSGLAKVN